MDEYVDVVNEDDKVIGRKSKNLIHRDGDWHRVSHVLVLNKKSEVLCHKRSSTKEVFAGKWDFIIGGHVLSGESYYEAAKRELKEEVGMKNEIYEIGTWKGLSDPAIRHKTIVKIFATMYDGNVKFLKLDKKEIEKLKFIKISDLEKISKSERKKEFVSFAYFDEIIQKIKKQFFHQ